MPLNRLTTPRERLTANRTYYVRSDGNNGNTGLVDSAGGAFATIGMGLTAAGSLDSGGNNITVQIGDGTWTEVGLLLPNMVGDGTFTLQGNTGTPANCVISPATGHALSTVHPLARWTIQGFKLVTTSGGHCLNCAGGYLSTGAMEFGAAASGNGHVQASDRGRISIGSNYTISGGARQHIAATDLSLVRTSGITVTVSGTPAWSTAFIDVQRHALIVAVGNTYSGSATGARFLTTLGGGIYTAGATAASYFPGNAGGTTTAPGWTDQV